MRILRGGETYKDLFDPLLRWRVGAVVALAASRGPGGAGRVSDLKRKPV